MSSRKGHPSCRNHMWSLPSVVLPKALIYQQRSFLARLLCDSIRSLAQNIDSWNGFACNPCHQIFLTMKRDQGFVLPVGYKPMHGQTQASRWNEIQSSFFFSSLIGKLHTITDIHSIECISKNYWRIHICRYLSQHLIELNPHDFDQLMTWDFLNCMNRTGSSFRTLTSRWQPLKSIIWSWLEADQSTQHTKRIWNRQPASAGFV